jgi:hypothetical protein
MADGLGASVREALLGASGVARPSEIVEAGSLLAFPVDDEPLVLIGFG